MFSEPYGQVPELEIVEIFSMVVAEVDILNRRNQLSFRRYFQSDHKLGKD